MIKNIACLLVFIFAFSNASIARECYPVKIDAKLVYDEVAVLTNSEYKKLDEYLIKVSNQTSNQIVIIIDLCGIDQASYVIELGHQWGFG
ncbi:MAG: putative membrane protein YgcG [Glaciecola sp.]|jgi:uncharacterized membrane protein YgcG